MARFFAWMGPIALGAVAIASPSHAAVPANAGLSRPPFVLVADDMVGGMQDRHRGMGMPDRQGMGMGMQDRMSTMERQRMGVPQGHGGMGMGPGMGGQTLDRLDGRLAFLHAELRITQQQMPAWDAFATALRGARDHLAEARTALQDGEKASDPLGRLDAYERHMAARLKALHDSRIAFAKLYGTLDDEQKRTANELVVPLLSSL
ncbi:Spy/CpxP family protein refolding chaperone [Roseicella aerolata]|uniref:Spy/CpxP family protein refolding chaperone n=1 Tax=Roseicella aerolata TaxID=2883479 RepID=A0A9X1LD99_9PROT|nr:Spy/CpxP family protein refolding chaperone [Roseicella aerolata]MCB4824873.1 Spy/CpxP family protein refolding chaperone [Roseicella aerolata]